MKFIHLIIMLLLFNGCAFKEVKSWEKKTLAEDIMQYGGINPAVTKFQSHIYFSKEAARGGSGVGGGGCGCN